MADNIRDGYFEETNNYIPLRPTNVEKYVKTDPKDYIVSPEELKNLLTSGETGGTEHDAEQDKKLKELLGLTEDGKLSLSVVDGSVVTSDMNISESISALANQASESKDIIESNKSSIDILNGDEDTVGSVKNTVNAVVNEKLQGLVDGAPEALDTLKEIADWINDHGSITSGITNKLQELADKDEEIKDEIDDEISAREAQDALLKGLIDQETTQREISITALQTTLASNIARLNATDNELVRLIGVEQDKNQANKENIELLNLLLDTEKSDRESANNELKTLIQTESNRAKESENAIVTQVATNWSETVNLVDNLANIHTQHVQTLTQAIQNVEGQQNIDRSSNNEKFNDLEGRVSKLEEGVQGGEYIA